MSMKRKYHPIHTFNTIGTFDVYAKYGQLTSETKTIEIMPFNYI